MTSEKSTTLMSFLAPVSTRLGVGSNTFVVGGAVRNHLLGLPIKDLDLVIDSVATKGKDSAWLAQELQKVIPAKTNLTTNQYGVAILTVTGPWILEGQDLKGETIEIANARKESYGNPEGKGYKPHMVEPATIQEDLARREFTFNTLLWRLGNLTKGPEGVPVLDLTGKGKDDLRAKIIRTPSEPDKTFSDDPTRMLRAIKFSTRLGFRLSKKTFASIQANADKLKAMPWDAVRKILVEDILLGPNPHKSLDLMSQLGLNRVIQDMARDEPNFATALGRGSECLDHLLCLRLVLDLSWKIKTPLTFLSGEQQSRLRGILEVVPEEEGGSLVDSLRKPRLNQVKLFEQFQIPAQERGIVVKVARELLLATPELARNTDLLEDHVAARLRGSSS